MKSSPHTDTEHIEVAIKKIKSLWWKCWLAPSAKGLPVVLEFSALPLPGTAFPGFVLLLFCGLLLFFFLSHTDVFPNQET